MKSSVFFFCSVITVAIFLVEVNNGLKHQLITLLYKKYQASR